MPEATVGRIPCSRSTLVEVHIDEEHTLLPGSDVALLRTTNPGSAHAGGPTGLVRSPVGSEVHGSERATDGQIGREGGGGTVEDLCGATPESRGERVHLEPGLVEARFDLGHRCPPRFWSGESSRTGRPAFR